MKPTHFFSGLSKSPVLLHKCLKSKGYMEFSTVSSSCSFLHMRSSGDSAPSDQGREHQMDIHVLVHVFDAFFKGEIPRCESVGQRVLHIVKSFGIILLKLPEGGGMGEWAIAYEYLFIFSSNPRHTQELFKATKNCLPSESSHNPCFVPLQS